MNLRLSRLEADTAQYGRYLRFDVLVWGDTANKDDKPDIVVRGCRWFAGRVLRGPSLRRAKGDFYDLAGFSDRVRDAIETSLRKSELWGEDLEVGRRKQAADEGLEVEI